MPCLRTIGMLCAICWLNASCGLLAQTAMAQEFFNAPKARIAHRQAIERGIELLRGSVDRYPQHRQ
ncbi:MAG: hypothetical protein ACK6A7_20255 [Planctomycetota bacterium]